MRPGSCSPARPVSRPRKSRRSTGSRGSRWPGRCARRARVVIGAYVADCFVAAPRLPRWGEEYEVRSIRTSPGGKALNQAVALARLGAHVSAIGAVGEDGLGRDIMSALTREGIETEFFITCEKAATSICICFVGDNGQTSFVWHIDEGVAVTAEIVRAAEAALRRADAVLVTFEAPVPTIREVLKLAHRCDAQVFLQPAPPLSNPSAAATLPWENVDVLVPNEAEARAILEGVGVKRQALQEDDLADALASELGVPLVVVTLGESGCVSNSSGVARRYSSSADSASRYDGGKRRLHSDTSGVPGGRKTRNGRHRGSHCGSGHQYQPPWRSRVHAIPGLMLSWLGCQLRLVMRSAVVCGMSIAGQYPYSPPPESVSRLPSSWIGKACRSGDQPRGQRAVPYPIQRR